jgi:hypothetical protein
MRCRPLLGAAVLGLVLFGARPAEARILDLYAGATAGGIAGWGTTPNTPDFFDSTRGPGVGFDLGLKLLMVIDVQANFFQVFDSSGAAGTLIQLLLGTGVDIPICDSKLPNGASQCFLRPEVAGGLGFGTPGPVSPPLTDSQVSAKGIVVNGTVGYEYFLNDFLAVGAQGMFGYHYFLGGDAVNTAQGHSSGYQFGGVGTFTFHLGF